MKSKAQWITRTGILLALLVILQVVTKSAGQLVTGSGVNAVLAVSVLVAGLSSGMTVALVSPFVAFLLGIGPQLLPIVPAIALGNGLYVLLLNCIYRKSLLRQILALMCAAAVKFAALHLVIVRVLCSVLPLKQPQIATFSTMFTWPQLTTALIGGAVALLIVPVLRKALKQ